MELKKSRHDATKNIKIHIHKNRVAARFRVQKISSVHDTLDQACQTQTTSRAAKVTKTAKGAAEMCESPEWATFY